MVYYLNANDFGLSQGHLMTNVEGPLFVMFTSKNCKHCDNFMPTFQDLNGSVVGMNFGICNVTGANSSVHQMSLNSSTPIEGTPKFILYNNGIPFAEYKGARTRQSVIAFMQEIISKLNQGNSFNNGNRQQVPVRSRMGQSQPQFPQVPQVPQVVQAAHQGRPNPEFQQQMTGQTHAQTQPPAPKKFSISPTTGVKEFETSYGRPYNTTNEQEFLDYEQAYLEQHKR